jgi:hypothetical protein
MAQFSRPQPFPLIEFAPAMIHFWRREPKSVRSLRFDKIQQGFSDSVALHRSRNENLVNFISLKGNKTNNPGGYDGDMDRPVLRYFLAKETPKRG